MQTRNIEGSIHASKSGKMKIKLVAIAKRLKFDTSLQKPVNYFSSIKRFYASVMLLFFTLSITPKIYLHDLFAGHTDAVIKASNDGKAQVYSKGYNCDCNSLVATSPFTEESDAVSSILPVAYPSLFISLTTPVYACGHNFLELRGPPTIG